MIPSVLMANTGREPMTLAYQQSIMCCVVSGITPAQLNAGFILMGSGHGRQLRLLRFRIVVNGAAIGAVTDIRLSTTDATPVDLITILQAGLTLGVRMSDISAGSLYGTGFPLKQSSGSGIQLRKTGSAATGAFTIDVLLEFDVI